VHAAFGEYFIKTRKINTEYGKMIVWAFEAQLDSDYVVISNMDEAPYLL
jgi:uncharacterized protein (UPF0332 family)